MTDDFDWLEPMKTRTRQLEEETKRIREIREENLKQKPPAYLTQENPWSKLGQEEISDLHSILIYCKEKGLYDELRHNTQSCVEVNVEHLEKILELIHYSD
jgi:hypothetical protein